MIIIVIAITVVDVISVVLVGAVTTQEQLASATVNGASRSTRFYLLLLFRL